MQAKQSIRIVVLYICGHASEMSKESVRVALYSNMHCIVFTFSSGQGDDRKYWMDAVVAGALSYWDVWLLALRRLFLFGPICRALKHRLHILIAEHSRFKY